MKWARCPHCRTVNDLDRYTFCDGCNTDLAAARPLAQASAPAVQREAGRDGSVGRTILLSLGVLCIFGILGICLSSRADERIGFFLLSLPIVCIFLWFAMARKIHASGNNLIAKGFLYFMAVIPAVIGTFILAFIMCAAIG